MYRAMWPVQYFAPTSSSKWGLARLDFASIPVYSLRSAWKIANALCKRFHLVKTCHGNTASEVFPDCKYRKVKESSGKMNSCTLHRSSKGRRPAGHPTLYDQAWHSARETQAARIMLRPMELHKSWLCGFSSSEGGQTLPLTVPTMM